MAGIDKIAIVFSIAIVVAGVGFAFYASSIQNEAPNTYAPVITRTEKPIMQETPQEERIVVKTPVVTAPVAETPRSETVNIIIPTGTSSPGCETSNKCFSPASITINVGDTVEWKNSDTTPHTITSGSPSDGPSGVFDSSLIKSGNSFEFTFNESGSYDYFDMIHPWMVGSVSVN
ncbi:MAG: cupredoxin domain-containing protein [Nitrosarchaeum sp.]|nr:cupredoxin domain-containing protein [Nitrosarchaeum sp.]